MSNLRYGMKEVANVIFFDIVTNKPVAFLDTLKVSSIENESETAEARGGRGNNKLMTWDYGRTANLSISDALLSDTTIAMLAGDEMKNSNIKVVGREQVIAGAEKEGFTPDVPVLATEVVLDETGTSQVSVYEYVDGLLGAEVTSVTTTAKVFTKDSDQTEHTFDVIGGLVSGKEYMVFYEYTVASGANQITFSGEKFPATYRVVGETLVRGEDGVDHKMQFEIPKAKMQSTFSLTMDVENVATFDFTLEVLMDAKSKGKELYKITRL